MTEEKIVEVEIKAKPSVLAKVKTPDGDAFIKFKNLKQNQLQKLLIDFEKNFGDALSQVLASVISVENLKESSELVTLEQVQTGEIEPETAQAIFQAFTKVMEARNKPLEVSDEKKEQAASDSAAA
jgi:glycyl-tRNA synthetase (class II)